MASWNKVTEFKGVIEAAEISAQAINDSTSPKKKSLIETTSPASLASSTFSNLSSAEDIAITKDMGRNEQSFLMEIAGPKIEVPDLLKFETARNHSLSNTIMSRLKDLEREYNELVALQKWNQFVEEFKINTQVRLNQNYYLYESGDRKFLSLLSPEELGSSYTFHGKTRLHSEGFFVKVEEEKSMAKPA